MARCIVKEYLEMKNHCHLPLKAKTWKPLLYYWYYSAQPIHINICVDKCDTLVTWDCGSWCVNCHGREKRTSVFEAELEVKLNPSCILKHAAHCGFAPAMQFANNIEWLDLYADFTHVSLFDHWKRNTHCQPIKCPLLYNYSAQMVGCSSCWVECLSCLLSMFPP